MLGLVLVFVTGEIEVPRHLSVCVEHRRMPVSAPHRHREVRAGLDVVVREWRKAVAKYILRLEVAVRVVPLDRVCSAPLSRWPADLPYRFHLLVDDLDAPPRTA